MEGKAGGIEEGGRDVGNERRRRRMRGWRERVMALEQTQNSH